MELAKFSHEILNEAASNAVCSGTVTSRDFAENTDVPMKSADGQLWT